MPDEKRIGIKLYVDDGELKEAYKNIERLEKDTVTIKCDYDPDTKKLIADTEAALKQLEKQPASKIKFELDTSALQKSLKEVQSLAKKSAAEIQAAFDKATKPRTNAGLRKSVLGKASFSSDAEEASEELLKYREAAIKKVQDVKIDLDDPTAEINVQKIYDYGKALSELRSVLLDVQSVADKKGLKLPDIDASFGIEETTKKFKELQKNTPSLIQNFSKAEIERLTSLYSDMSNQLMGIAKGFNTSAGKGTAGATGVFDDMAADAAEAAGKVKGAVDEINGAVASVGDKPIEVDVDVDKLKADLEAARTAIRELMDELEGTKGENRNLLALNESRANDIIDQAGLLKAYEEELDKANQEIKKLDDALKRNGPGEDYWKGYYEDAQQSLDLLEGELAHAKAKIEEFQTAFNSSLADKIINKYTKITGKTSEIFNSWVESALEGLHFDEISAPMLKSFFEEIDFADTRNAIKEIVSIINDYKTGFLSAEEATKGFENAIFAQFEAIIPTVREANSDIAALANTLKRYGEANNLSWGEGEESFYQSSSKKFFNWLSNNGTEAEKRIFRINEGLEGCRRALLGMQVNTGGLAVFDSTHDLDLLTFYDGKFDQFIQDIEQEKVRATQANSELEQLRNTLIETFNIPMNKDGTLTVTLDQLREIVSICPQAQAYIDQIESRFNDVSSMAQKELPAQNIVQTGSLEDEVTDVTGALKAETEAFQTEGATVTSIVEKEINELNALKQVIDKITGAVNEKTSAFGGLEVLSKLSDINSVFSTQSTNFIDQQLKQINQAKAKYSRAGIKDLSNLDLMRDTLNKDFNFAALSQMGDAGAINEAISAYVSMFSEITREYDEMIAHMRGNKLQDAFGTGIDTTLKKVQERIGKYADTDFINVDNLERIRTIMGQLESYKELDLISESDEKDVKNLTSELNNLVKNLTKADNLRFNNKGSFIGSLTGTNADKANMENMIKTYDKLKDKQIEFTKWTGDWNKQVTATFTARGSDGTLTTYAATFDKAIGSVRMLQKAETEYVSGFSKFVSSIKGKFAELTRYITVLDVVQKAFQAFKQGIQAVKDIDAAMTELKKVTDETENAYARFGETAGKIATEVGSTRKEITNSTADFARLGYSMDDATELARVAAIYKNVGDGIDIDTATEDIISTMKAFGIEADRSMEIIDKLNEVGRRVIAHLRSNVQIIKVAI